MTPKPLAIARDRGKELAGSSRVAASYDRPSMPWHTLDSPFAPSPTAVRVQGVDVLIAELDGDWFAVEDRCSHAGCSFVTDGEVDGATVICNCHGSEFDVRTGEVLVPPALDPIRTFPVRISNGRLEIEL